MVVGTAGDQVEATLDQGLGQGAGVGDDGLGVLAERRGRRLPQRDGDRRGGVVVRATLQTGKDRLVQRRGMLRVRHQHRATRAAQRLVRGGGDHRGVPDRGGMRTPGDEPGDVRDVGDEHGADLPRDLGETREVDRARDRRAAAEDDLRTLGQREVTHLVQVDPAGVGPQPVTNAAEPLAGRRHAPPVGEVPAHRQRQTHDRVAGLGEGQVDGQVRRRPGVRLDIGVLDPEQRLRPVDGEGLDRVDDLLALVVALPDVPLGVLVGQHRTGCLEHRGGHVVLRGDQPDGPVLAGGLGLDQTRDLRIGDGQFGKGWVVHSNLRHVSFGRRHPDARHRPAHRSPVVSSTSVRQSRLHLDPSRRPPPDAPPHSPSRHRTLWTTPRPPPNGPPITRTFDWVTSGPACPAKRDVVLYRGVTGPSIVITEADT